MNIIFICTGNICRSPMAEYILNHLAMERGMDMRAVSAGCSDWEAEGPATKYAVQAVDELYGIDMERHRARHFTPGLAEGMDLVIAMEAHHASYARNILPDGGSRVRLLHEWAYGDPATGVADPWGQSMKVYRECAAEIYDAISAAMDNYSDPH